MGATLRGRQLSRRGEPLDLLLEKLSDWVAERAREMLGVGGKGRVVCAYPGYSMSWRSEALRLTRLRKCKKREKLSPVFQWRLHSTRSGC